MLQALDKILIFELWCQLGALKI